MIFYRQLGPIQAMTFDLDDTLYDNRPVIRQVEAKAMAWLHQHHPVSATRSFDWWRAIKRQVLSDDAWLKNDVTAWRYQQILTGLMELGYSHAQADLAASELIERVLEFRSDFTVPDESHQVLDQLASVMPLVAITNGNVDVDKIGLAGYFSLILKAGPDGYAKPHPQLFDKAVQFLDLPRVSILHVGDHVVTDVLGAKNSGLSACWFNDQFQSIYDQPRATTLPDVEVKRLQDLLLLSEI
ncbi:2-haloalkanoic acid dehalogenase [Vibrio caribbeanicus]|uniref:2-haloalkanoic acid dehalogenase n=1 Tax=Vibrio caribbeanicus TaxID=701175 RepID=A0ACC4NT12_9VIBR|nr:5-amino-6-(5-phospho-D-ribitylamino)uracil phosphatase YigB [Vibrio caribbeanicus]KHD23651.1 2-haloalkanoic acid dehalogenase [Vibrio caribbeanicus]